jgi:hypothetical protein
VKDSETLWCIHDRLEQGWCKTALRNIYGDVCIIGAACDVTGIIALAQPALNHIQETISATTPYGGIIKFNGSSTKEEVLNLVAKTAIRLEEQGL